jgi:NADH-quinone oxidoreductase subunit A
MLRQIQSEYFSILVFVFVSLILASVLYSLSFLIARNYNDSEKLSAYECGFEPYDDGRTAFDVRFYLVAILFIIFDREAAFLFPWCVSLSQINLEGFYAMIDFVLELGIGFWYAWRIGARE